jgi:eukaryotic-like serine/threonine-protein kinase
MTAPELLDDPIARELAPAIAGRYAIERELGRGGMGAVFLARDLKLDRPVAIKVLPPELAVRPELRERFLRETRTAASFSHPNIVSVHSVEETPGLLFFVMAYIEGETLSQRVRRQGPLPVPEALRMLQEVAWALSYAHGRGVVHRDIKPDNILLERSTGRALVMDFGIARSVAASGLTQMGETVGTPHFMSPEQVAGDKVDGRSDLYALGVVGYFAVTGRLPFDGETAQAVMVAQISQTAPPVSRFRPDLPAPLATAIQRCLSKAPEERFATGEALVEALDQVRGRQVEIAPAIRVWTVRADQFFRNGLILALMMPQFIQFGAQWARALFGAVVFVVVVPALWAQIPLGMRELARQGFAYADLRSAILAIDGEREAVLSAMRADPRHARRRRRRWLILLAGFALSIGTIVIALATGHETSPGAFKVSTPALLASFAALCVFMVCLVFSAATVASSGRFDRRLHALWTGGVGKLLFRLGTWRLSDLSPNAAATPGTRGAQTLLDTLEGDSRRRLAKARVTLERLEGEIERLERRERELEAAATEARVNAPSLPGTSTERQQALQADLDRARREAGERRVTMLGALENIRLALVRLKSKIGTPEDVERDLAEADRLLDVRRET